MIIVMRTGCSRSQVDVVSERLSQMGYAINPIYGVEKTIVGAVGVPEYDKLEAADQIRGLDGVEDVIFISKPYKFVAKEFRSGKTVVDVDGVMIGAAEVIVMAGPCTVESEKQLMTTAEAVARSGSKFLRGGAYKPSTSPYSYQGMGLPGLQLLQAAGRRFGLKVVTEVMHVGKVEEVCAYADMLQVGTRNMQNYDLLREVGLSKKPVLLKRGMTAKLEEWLLAAEYIASAGNEHIVLCERGIRTFEPYTRNTLDLSAVPALNSLTHLPVIVDPSQGTGRRDLVGPMSKAAIACGADGLLVEVHPNPDKAVKDGVQSIDISAFERLMPELAAVAGALGRMLPLPTSTVA